MENMKIVVTQTTEEGLVLDAYVAGQDIEFNTFKDISIISAPSGTADGVRLNAQDGSHLVSFNQFIDVEITDFLQAYHFSEQGGGNTGPTDNTVVNGQQRRSTTPVAGNGFQLDAGTADNQFYGGDVSYFTTCINLAASAAVVDNHFFGNVPEACTNAVVVGTGATDNQFYGVAFGTEAFTDNGIRTVVQHGNNTIGPGGTSAQKQGAAYLNLTLISANGTLQTLTSSASSNRTSNIPETGGNNTFIMAPTGGPSRMQNFAGAITPASVNATTCAEQSFTPAGLSAILSTDLIFINATSSMATNLAFPVAWRSISGGVAITYCNPTAGALTPAAVTLNVTDIR